MPPFAKLCSLLCLMLITACASTEPTNDAENMPDKKGGQESVAMLSQTPKNKPTDSWDEEWKRWQEESKIKKISANLFPTATRVRVYQGELSLQIDDNGKATTQKYLPDANHYPTVSAKSGGFLTAAEIKTLRKSVNYTLPPPAIAGCCIPRHGFAFYDKTGKYLGHLKVCYECGCAQISPSSAHDPKLNWIDWDAAALQKIIEAHHLKVRSR